MTLSFSQNRGNMRRFQIIFLLLLLSMFIFETQSIKFFSKETEQKANKIPDTTSPPKVQDQDHKQLTLSKTAQQLKNQGSKSAQVVQKPQEAKTQTSKSSSTPKPEQKIQPKSSNDKTLETFFGQSIQKKSSEVPSGSAPAPVMTVKAQEHKSDLTSVPSFSPTTVTTIAQPDQKANQSSSKIGDLFGDQKGAKPLKADKAKIEQQPKTEHNSQSKLAITDIKPSKNQKIEKLSQDEKAIDLSESTQDKEEKSQTKTKQKDTDKKIEKQDKKSDQQKQQQEESSGDVYYPVSKKRTHKQEPKAEANSKQNQKKAEEKSQTKQESQDDQNSHKSTLESKKSKRQDTESQSQQVIYPKKSLKTSKKKTSGQQNPQQSKQKYSLTLFMTFCLYSLIIVLVIVTIKCTSSSSKLVRSVELMFGALWNMFLIKKGYRKMAIDDHQDEVTQKEEQITVGYTVQDNNKQIFWEKNSVQGI